jgi:hypothetical protein
MRAGEGDVDAGSDEQAAAECWVCDRLFADNASPSAIINTVVDLATPPL